MVLQPADRSLVAYDGVPARRLAGEIQLNNPLGFEFLKACPPLHRSVHPWDVQGYKFVWELCQLSSPTP